MKAEMPFDRSCAIEIKQTTTTRLPFSAVKDHQLEALNAARSYIGILYKAPDDSRGVKPFDLFFLRNAGALIVIKYPGQFSLIDYDVFMKEKNQSKEKSLTRERAEAIGWKTIKLGKK